MRSFRPFVRVVLFAACLLAAAPALGAGLFGGPPEPGQMPSRFLRIDGFDAGGGLVGVRALMSVRIAKASYTANRFRFGAALVDFYSGFGDWRAATALPIHIGFTVWSNPRRTWLFYGALPEAYFEASGSLLSLEEQDGGMWDWKYGPSVRAAACFDIDYYGLGARLEAGWVNLQREVSTSGGRVNAVYLGVQLRGLAFGIGLN